jgi:hypothetical protein
VSSQTAVSRRKPNHTLGNIKRKLKSIEVKYRVSWQELYYLAEISDNWKSLLEKAESEEIISDLAKLFELDNKYKKITRKSLLKELDEEWHG